MSGAPLNFSFGEETNLNSISQMPNMSKTIGCWVKEITLIKINSFVNSEFENETDPETISFSGVIQPFKAETIKYSEDGKRSWQWLRIHSFSGPLNLITTDRIKITSVPAFQDTTYKIMGINDWSLNGYIEYEAIRDYS